MGRLITPDQAAHWYTRDGQPMYTVPKKDGTPRNTTLADARKMDLVPSVTGIIGIIAKPALEAWKIEQGILAALTLPRLPNEPDQDFAKRVVEDSSQQVGKAAEIGSSVHAFIEGYLAGEPVTRVSGYEPTCLAAQSWIDQNIQGKGHIETSFASELGFGGRIDWFGTMSDGRWGLIDWKTQNVKPGKSPNFYETWDLQLAAYRHAIEELGRQKNFEIGWIDRRLSVVISTNPENPGIWEKEWFGNSMPQFLSALELWKWQNGYDPEKKGEVA